MAAQPTRVWPSAPRLHPPTVPPPRRLPRPPPWRSRVIIPTASHPFRRHFLTGWSGLISRGPLWDSTQDPWEIWPLLRSQYQWLLPTRRPARPPSRLRPCYSVLILRMMALKQAKVHFNGLTPADSSADPEFELQTGLALLQGLVFDLRRDLDDLRFRLEILDGKASQFLQFLSALQGAHHPPAGEAHAAGAETPVLAPAPHWGLRRTTHQSRRRTCHQSSRRMQCRWTGHQSRRSHSSRGLDTRRLLHGRVAALQPHHVICTGVYFIMLSV
jgi:hypothetical protein